MPETVLCGADLVVPCVDRLGDGRLDAVYVLRMNVFENGFADQGVLLVPEDPRGRGALVFDDARTVDEADDVR